MTKLDLKYLDLLIESLKKPEDWKLEYAAAVDCSWNEYLGPVIYKGEDKIEFRFFLNNQGAWINGNFARQIDFPLLWFLDKKLRKKHKEYKAAKKAMINYLHKRVKEKREQILEQTITK